MKEKIYIKDNLLLLYKNILKKYHPDVCHNSDKNYVNILNGYEKLKQNKLKIKLIVSPEKYFLGFTYTLFEQKEIKIKCQRDRQVDEIEINDGTSKVILLLYIDKNKKSNIYFNGNEIVYKVNVVEENDSYRIDFPKKIFNKIIGINDIKSIDGKIMIKNCGIYVDNKRCPVIFEKGR